MTCPNHALHSSQGNSDQPHFIVTQDTKLAIDACEALSWSLIENVMQSASRSAVDWRTTNWWAIMTPEEQRHLTAVRNTLPAGMTRQFTFLLMFCFRHDAVL